MPPSRKRQTTPPEASPAKRTATAPPTPAAPAPDLPQHALGLVPGPDRFVSEGREWSMSFQTQLDTLLEPLLGENSPPFLCHNPSLRPTLAHTRACLMNAINDIDYMISANAFFDVPRPCTEICTAAPPPVTHHKSIATDPPAEPTAADPLPTVPRTYASVATGTLATPPKISDPKPPPKPPRSKPKGLGLAPARSSVAPVRLIVRPGPSATVLEFPFAALFLKGPSEPFRLLSHALALNPSTRDVKLLGVHQSRSKNLVVSLDPGTSDADVANITPITCTALTPQYPSGPGPTPTVIRDVPWSKLLVSSVLARSGPGAPTFPEADVQTSFLTNPAVSALKITRPPRWIRNPASITGAHSSFTFSFEDPDGSLARSLAKSSSLFVFGVPVHLKRWIEKPLAKRKESLRRRMATSSSD